MEAFLVDEWLGDAETIPIADDASVSGAREKAREVASAQGLSPIEAGRLATIASELARNQLKHARGGQVAFVVGAAQRGWRADLERAPIAPSETLVVYTDGIASRPSIAEDFALLREHPIVIAHQLALRFARDDDDVLVLVAR